MLAKLALCRTPALGGKTFHCDDCDETTEVYHSCSDRNCPQCSGCKRYDFAERAEQLILPGVDYYQVVFTLPSVLSEMALANRIELSDLLFTAAGKALSKTVRTQQGYEPAAMMVLHTWNQQLQPHWHVHALVPGGGPSLEGEGWKSAQAPAGVLNSDGFYLVDAISLREAFRKFALAQLKRLYKQRKLKLGGKFFYLQDDQGFESFCDELAAVDWVSFIQPPPTPLCKAEQVVRYLTRYLTGGPISDSRIIAADDQQVTFLARSGQRVGGERTQVPVTLDTLEFVRRWCDHIQPDQLTKTRYFGGWCSRHRTNYQARCRELLESTPASPADSAAGTADQEDSPAALVASEPVVPEPLVRSGHTCSHCGSEQLRLTRSVGKPEWWQVLSHLDSRCPAWYAEQEHARFCEELEREHGISYEDWALEMRIESPMGTGSSASRAAPTREYHQNFLPGFTPDRDFALDSF